jgi:HSP20 family protein
MNDIIRSGERRTWDPFGDIDTLLSTLMRPVYSGQERGGSALVPAVDITETDQAYLVRAELPGVKKDDLQITINDGVLTINAETRQESEAKENGRLIRQERRYGKFVRSMRLGNDVDENNVSADYRDGVLSLTLPKAEEVKPRRIDVNVG